MNSKRRSAHLCSASCRARAALIAFILVPLASAAHAGAISLRSTARLEAGQPVLLGDIAVLEGDDARALAGQVILQSAALPPRGINWTDVSVADVRTALHDAHVDLGGISISGGACSVGISPPTSLIHAATELDEPRPPQVVGAESAGTIRLLVARSVAQLLGVDPVDLRLVFDEKDQPFLATSEFGRRVAVQPVSTARAPRVMVEVRVFAGADARLLDRRRVRVEAQVHTEVVVAERTMRRGVVLDAAALRSDRLWLDPDPKTPVSSIAEAVGSIARRRILAGNVLTDADLEPPILIERGQLVTVHCLRSGFEIQSRARARQDGRLREPIELRMDGSKRSFRAIVDGRGIAVLDLDHPRAQSDSTEAHR